MNKNNYKERDKQVIWHPFTQMQTADLSIPIVRGKGAVLYDEEGNEYIDAVSSWWVNIHGHSHPHIQERVSKQLGTLEHVIFAGFTHPWAIELSEKILELNPSGHGKVFFSDNGSTANEVGLKMAFQYWWNKGIKRDKVVAFEDAYHGDTVGAMSAGGRGIFSSPFETILFDVAHLPPPDGENKADVVEKFRSLFERGDVAAFIYEPVVMGAGGMIMYDIEAMNEILAAARENDVILIADEVMTGFGRTGKMFASEYFDIYPDIMSLSKALTGGTMPLSLTTCKDYIYEAFLSEDKTKTFFHGHSYTGNPTACAAALASLELLERPEFRQNIDRINGQHRAFMAKIGSNPMIKNCRLKGTILAFEIVSDSQDSYLNEVRDIIYNSMISQGVLLRPLGNTVYILPPYIISNEQLEKVYSSIMKVLDLFGGN